MIKISFLVCLIALFGCDNSRTTNKYFTTAEALSANTHKILIKISHESKFYDPESFSIGGHDVCETTTKSYSFIYDYILDEMNFDNNVFSGSTWIINDSLYFLNLSDSSLYFENGKIREGEKIINTTMPQYESDLTLSDSDSIQLFTNGFQFGYTTISSVSEVWTIRENSEWLVQELDKVESHNPILYGKPLGLFLDSSQILRGLFVWNGSDSLYSASYSLASNSFDTASFIFGENVSEYSYFTQFNSQIAGFRKSGGCDIIELNENEIIVQNIDCVVPENRIIKVHDFKFVDSNLGTEFIISSDYNYWLQKIDSSDLETTIFNEC